MTSTDWKGHLAVVSVDADRPRGEVIGEDADPRGPVRFAAYCQLRNYGMSPRLAFTLTQAGYASPSLIVAAGVDATPRQKDGQIGIHLSRLAAPAPRRDPRSPLGAS